MDNNIVTVEYKGKKYTCRYVYHFPVDATVLVGPESLDVELGKDDYKGKALTIDESIYCYVPDEVFEYNEDDFQEYLTEYYD